MGKDITKYILSDLDLYVGATPVGAAVPNTLPHDLTTWMARKIAMERQIGATSEAALYDGTDLTPDVRNYLNNLTSG